MRNKEEIVEDWRRTLKTRVISDIQIAGQLLTLEVLLDIRELLTPLKENKPEYWTKPPHEEQ